ncbi:unnamed protein product, partial [Allacma fusca]
MDVTSEDKSNLEELSIIERFKKSSPFRNIMKYCVVIFDGQSEEDVEVVPESWITNENKQCYWPGHLSASGISTAVNRGHSYEETWEIHGIAEFFGPYDNPIDARKKARREAERKSDATTDTEGPRKRKLPSRFLGVLPMKFKQGKTTNSCSATHPSYPPKLQPRDKVGTSFLTQSVVVQQSANVSHPASLPPANSIITTTGDTFEKSVLASLSVLKMRMKSMEESHALMLEQLRSINQNAAGRRSLKTVSFPVKTLKDLDELEKQIASNSDVYEEVANALDCLGGNN